MQVIYDLSVLGGGFYDNSARTGIARVIENLALHLYGSENLDLQFCAFRSLIQFVQTTKYLEQDYLPGGERLCQGSVVTKKLLQALAEKYHEPIGPDQQLKFMERVLNYCLRHLNTHVPIIDPVILSTADIFHSTFYPFQKHLRISQKTKRFITIYDMIPIMQPQFFESDVNHIINNVIESIHPDDWILTISQSTKNDVCNCLGFDASRVMVTPLAASSLFYSCQDKDRILSVTKKYQIPATPYILCLCTLEPRKNISQIIKCFIRLLQEHNITDLNLVLAGSKGWDFANVFDEIVHAPKLAERIIITGYVADDDLAPLYSGALMFVYVPFYEGFGLPPLEAMQCGVPVITSNTSSLPEVVGDAGILVEPTDSDALSHAMYDLYSHDALRQRMAAKSLERASHFSWALCAKKTLQAYEVAINK